MSYNPVMMKTMTTFGEYFRLCRVSARFSVLAFLTFGSSENSSSVFFCSQCCTSPPSSPPLLPGEQGDELRPISLKQQSVDIWILSHTLLLGAVSGAFIPEIISKLHLHHPENGVSRDPDQESPAEVHKQTGSELRTVLHLQAQGPEESVLFIIARL